MTNKKIVTKLMQCESKTAEELVLGSMMSQDDGPKIRIHDNRDFACNELSEDDFEFLDHRIIFNAIKKTYTTDSPPNTFEVMRFIEDSTNSGTVYWAHKIVNLTEIPGTSADIKYYCEIVKNNSSRRKSIEIYEEGKRRALDVNDDGYIEDVTRKLNDIGSSTSKCDDIINLYKESNYLEKLIKRKEYFDKHGEQEFTGVKTHFIDLDKLLNGFGKSSMIVLAARPSMGKTAFALNIAENVAFKSKKPVAIFSLEMSGEQLLERMICSICQIKSDGQKTGEYQAEDIKKISSTMEIFDDRKIFFDDQSSLKINEFKNRAKRMKEAYGIELIIIDYLQLLSGSSNKGSENRQQEVSEISRVIKSTARELNIPILCLSQLSRKVEERQDHTPRLSDLRESGAIEQDSDVVMFLYREDYYDKTNPTDVAKLIVAKNRHGATGIIKLLFQKEYAHFDNYSFENPYSERYNYVDYD